MDSWNEAVLQAMVNRGFMDPYQVIAGLLYALREQHRQAVYSGDGDDYRDGLDGFTGRHATTVAESVAFLLRQMGTANLSGADLAAEEGKPLKSNHMDWVGRGQAALADLLDYYLPVWAADGVDARVRAGLPPAPRPSDRPRVERLRLGGDSDADPQTN